MKVALIPARSGSKRFPNKNIKLLNGHPLIAYTITTAIRSDVFDKVIVCTDSHDYAEISRSYGAETPYLRNVENAGSSSPDIDWVTEAFHFLEKHYSEISVFSILRPTNPCRSVESIRKAYDILSSSGSDSVRAVSLCSEHPGKMWILNADKSSMNPLLPLSINSVPWHSNQYAALPPVYVQNASLEFAHGSCIRNLFSISGNVIAPYLTPIHEDIDINYPSDWDILVAGIKASKYQLINI